MEDLGGAFAAQVRLRLDCLEDRMMKKALALALAAALATSPAAVLAKNPHNPGNGDGVPPGLAKKPGGLPPGQAKKIYGRGERLPLTYMQTRYYISEPARYRLDPAPPGYRWVLVDEHAY